MNLIRCMQSHLLYGVRRYAYEPPIYKLRKYKNQPLTLTTQTTMEEQSPKTFSCHSIREKEGEYIEKWKMCSTQMCGLRFTTIFTVHFFPICCTLCHFLSSYLMSFWRFSSLYLFFFSWPFSCSERSMPLTRKTKTTIEWKHKKWIHKKKKKRKFLPRILVVFLCCCECHIDCRKPSSLEKVFIFFLAVADERTERNFETNARAFSRSGCMFDST